MTSATSSSAQAPSRCTVTRARPSTPTSSIEPTEANAARTLAALKDFGYDVSDLTVGDLLTSKVLIRQYVVETDIHPFVKGIDFDEVWADRVEDRIGETPAFFAGLESLIRMKEAAGRPKYLEDLRALRELRRR